MDVGGIYVGEEAYASKMRPEHAGHNRPVIGRGTSSSQDSQDNCGGRDKSEGGCVSSCHLPRQSASSDGYRGEDVTTNLRTVRSIPLTFLSLGPQNLEVRGPDCYRCPFDLSPESCEAECFDPLEKTLKENNGTEIYKYLIFDLLKKLRILCGSRKCSRTLIKTKVLFFDSNTF